MALSKVDRVHEMYAMHCPLFRTFPLRSAGAARRLTWMRRITRTPSSVSTSPVTSAVNLEASIWHASARLQTCPPFNRQLT